MKRIKIHRAQWIFDTPTEVAALRATENGCLVVDAEGMILDRGPFLEIQKKMSHQDASGSSSGVAGGTVEIIDHGENSIITPGFVDCHVHAPQMEMMAAAGYSLLDWLNTYTFPTEAKYKNLAYADARFKEFCSSLLKCGTTSAAIYATSDTGATRSLMKAAEKAGLRAFVGKVLMDRNAPDNLLQNSDTALLEVEELISEWGTSKKVRPSIAVRFAPTSTPELLRGAGELARKYPELVIQTHLSETKDELLWVKELFPEFKNYTEVYEKNGLITDKSVLGHGIYLRDSELEILRDKKSHIAHCPSSNFFLGSGLFPYEKVRAKGVSVGLGSDVGAGWDLSIQTTGRCCYEAQALQKYFMKASEVLYLATRGGAIALGQIHNLGLLEKNFRADFVVHNPAPNSLLSDRISRCSTPEEILSALLFLGGTSSVQSTFIDGACLWNK